MVLANIFLEPVLSGRGVSVEELTKGKERIQTFRVTRQLTNDLNTGLLSRGDWREAQFGGISIALLRFSMTQ